MTTLPAFVPVVPKDDFEAALIHSWLDLRVRKWEGNMQGSPLRYSASIPGDAPQDGWFPVWIVPMGAKDGRLLAKVCVERVNGFPALRWELCVENQPGPWNVWGGDNSSPHVTVKMLSELTWDRTPWEAQG